MNEPINHHYLPIFYLRRWCNSDGKVTHYYRPHNAVVASPITPKHTGYEPRLYSLPGHPPGKEQILETEFMAKAVDEPASKALTALIDGDALSMTEEMRIAWTRFLMAMNLRSPHSLVHISSSAHDIVQTNLTANPEEYMAIKSHDDPPNFYDWLQENAPHYLKNVGKMFLPGLIDNENIGDHLINMKWMKLELANSSFTLLLGDGPFIRTHGLKDSRCIVAVPLAPRLLFVATNTKERQSELLGYDATKIAKATNINTVGQADHDVYGCDDSHLQFVENRLCREPRRRTSF